MPFPSPGYPPDPGTETPSPISPAFQVDSLLLEPSGRTFPSSLGIIFTSKIQFSSVTQICLTLCDPMDCIMPGFPVITSSWSLLKPVSIESVMPSNHLILCRPLLLRLQSFPASGSFPMSQLFTSGGQSNGVSASTSVLPMNTQD